MAAVGVLVAGVTEFGEPSFEPNLDALRWKSATVVSSGSAHVANFLSQPGSSDHSKLALMMYLCAQGWEPMRERRALPEYYAEGGAQVFEATLTRPKWYFVCMAMSSRVLAKIGNLDSMSDVVPAI
eukprot:2034936-Alexandrium_andersonii.AAC.1